MSSNDELIRSLQTALESAPNTVPLRKHLADLLMANGEFVEAAREYQRALDLAPNDDQIKLALAEAYYRQGKEDVALVILEQFTRQPNPPARAFILAARAYLANGELEKAAHAYRQGVAADPALSDADLARQLTLTALEEPARDWPDAKDDPTPVAAGAAASTSAIVERPRVTFEDVGGMDKLKEEIRMKIIYPLDHPELYQAYGKTVGGGILMYGPPGCGKTHLARATAGEVQAHFIAVGLHDVLDMYIGQSEHNLHAIFELARNNTPCVLFFDEVDALGASRSDMRYSAGRKVINQFLSELDGVDTSNEGVLILAATNAPWHLDSALRRPGRFDRVIFVPPPDANARAAILRIMLADKPTDKINYDKLARQTDSFSGADLKGIIDVAVEQKLRQAMRSGVPAPLTNKGLLTAIKAGRPTIKEWFSTARNYAIYSNQGGLYNDVLDYLKISKGGASSSRSPFRRS